MKNAKLHYINKIKLKKRDRRVSLKHEEQSCFGGYTSYVRKKEERRRDNDKKKI